MRASTLPLIHRLTMAGVSGNAQNNKTSQTHCFVSAYSRAHGPSWKAVSTPCMNATNIGRHTHTHRRIRTATPTETDGKETNEHIWPAYDGRAMKNCYMSSSVDDACRTTLYLLVLSSLRVSLHLTCTVTEPLRTTNDDDQL